MLAFRNRNRLFCIPERIEGAQSREAAFSRHLISCFRSFSDALSVSAASSLNSVDLKIIFREVFNTK